MTRLAITVINGERLPGEFHGRVDPFVHIECGHSDERTKMDLNGGQNPKWNDTVHMEVDGRSPMTFKVKDKDGVDADFMCEGSLPPMEYERGYDGPIRMHSKHSGHGEGVINVRIHRA